MENLCPNEELEFKNIKERFHRLATLLSGNLPADTDSYQDWLIFLSEFKEELGNYNNHIGFLATLMAEEFLVKEVEVIPFDASAKAQGAMGLDIKEKTQSGARVIGEIKTTHPLKDDDLGAQQQATFRDDARKLQLEEAENKFFFLTDMKTFLLMKKRKYREMFRSVRVIHIPSGEEVISETEGNNA